MNKAQQLGDSFTPIRKLIQEYRLYYRQTKPVASSLSSFATLNGQKEQSAMDLKDSKELASRQSSQSQNKDRRMECPCGATHRFNDCAYVNPSKRSNSWKPKPEIQKKFDAIRSKGQENPRARALHAVEAQYKDVQP